MKKDTVVELRRPAQGQDLLSTMLREGAQRLVAQAVQAEFDDFLARVSGARLEDGRAAVVRNGFQPREILTGLGSVSVRIPKARSRGEEPAVFRSSLVPPYVRRAKSVEAVLPWLYLHGVSTGNMQEALAALLGPEAAGLSASAVARLKGCWMEEYRSWRRAKLGRDRWVYLWVDGIYSGLRAEDQRLCALVVVGVNERGEKKLLAIEDGVRESKQSWREVLLELKSRGLTIPPRLAVGDGGLGFWAAIRETTPNPAPAVLGAQDGECAQLPAEIPAAEGQGGAARDLDGRDQGAGPRCLRAVRRRLRCQVPQGDRVLGEGSRGAARFLRLSCRALDSHPHDQPHRVHVRYHQAPHRAYQGVSHARRHALDDLQVGHERGEELAPAPGIRMAGEGDQRSEVPRRD